MSLQVEGSQCKNSEEMKEIQSQSPQIIDAQVEVLNSEGQESIESPRSELSGISDNNIDEDSDQSPSIRRKIQGAANSISLPSK